MSNVQVYVNEENEGLLIANGKKIFSFKWLNINSKGNHHEHIKIKDMDIQKYVNENLEMALRKES